MILSSAIFRFKEIKYPQRRAVTATILLREWSWFRQDKIWGFYQRSEWMAVVRPTGIRRARTIPRRIEKEIRSGQGIHNLVLKMTTCITINSGFQHSRQKLGYSCSQQRIWEKEAMTQDIVAKIAASIHGNEKQFVSYFSSNTYLPFALCHSAKNFQYVIFSV